MWLSAALVALLVGLFVILGLLVTTQDSIKDAQERRSNSVMLADGLRQSSDDLTRMARLYVSTGEPRYREWFDEIIAIRDGTAPRPERYDLVYWDLVGPDDQRPRASGEPRSLVDLMEDAGFTAEELDLLHVAEDRSDALTIMENMAMNAVEGRFGGGEGQQAVNGTPDLEMAKQLVFGDEYMAEKTAIMEPINEFLVTIDRRTAKEVSSLNRRVQQFGWLALIVSALAISLSWLAVTVVRRRVLTPLKTFEAGVTAIGSGDYSQKVEYAGDDEFGDLVGAFDNMQVRLNETMSTLDEERRVLEAEVLARTAELRLTVNALEHSNRDLERLAVVGAHDLSEPLRKIRIFGERLADTVREGLDERSRDYLDRMTSAAARMQDLIDGLLEFSRITARAEPAVWVDLGSVARDVVADLEILVHDTGATIEIGDLPNIWGKPTLLRQLVQNLVANAVTFHEPGVAPWIRVSSEVRDDLDEGHVAFVVEDHGIGISADDAETAFDLFARLQSRADYQGSGIGLTICRRIVEHHRGTITIETNTPSGTRVVVALPIDGRSS